MTAYQIVFSKKAQKDIAEVIYMARLPAETLRTIFNLQQQLLE